jgi:hypothetical protein
MNDGHGYMKQIACFENCSLSRKTRDQQNSFISRNDNKRTSTMSRHEKTVLTADDSKASKSENLKRDTAIAIKKRCESYEICVLVGLKKHVL